MKPNLATFLSAHTTRTRIRTLYITSTRQHHATTDNLRFLAEYEYETKSIPALSTTALSFSIFILNMRHWLIHTFALASTLHSTCAFLCNGSRINASTKLFANLRGMETSKDSSITPLG
mmetsp:Transcript_13944/g.18271  ORF Transcript_13944/g.18271 Transcript_13944/m.18271 type:complete len:119 (-) Transcript_13944:951-1307(-)